MLGRELSKPIFQQNDRVRRFFKLQERETTEEAKVNIVNGMDILNMSKCVSI